MMWILKSLAAVLAFVTAFTCLTKAGVLHKSGLLWSPNVVFSVVALALTTVLLVALPEARAETARAWKTSSGWLVAFATLLYVGNVLLFSAMTDAPNPGLARAILSLEVILTTGMGALLATKGAVTLRQSLAMCAILLGVYGVVPT
jgi:drug/metabolite transporter (DMT)-like permease